MSGGQSEVEAAENLNLINKYNDYKFYYDLFIWKSACNKVHLSFGQKILKNIQGTQKVFNHRAKMCTLAAQGKWSAELEAK